MDSMRKSAQRVALGEDVPSGYLPKAYRMDNFDALEDERKRKLIQTQAAADIAERDPETGLLKTAGAIRGVPETQPGGDLYGVDPSGKAFVIPSRRKAVAAPSTGTVSPNAAANAPSPTPSSTTGSRQFGTGTTQNFNDMSKVPTALDKIQQFTPKALMDRGIEADRQRRIARANAIQSRLDRSGIEQNAAPGTRIVPLQPDDIRPAPTEQISAPREASFQSLGSMNKAQITPSAMSAFKAADELGARARARRLALQQTAQQNAIKKAQMSAYRAGGI